MRENRMPDPTPEKPPKPKIAADEEPPTEPAEDVKK